jgi:hypothetical protein
MRWAGNTRSSAVCCFRSTCPASLLEPFRAQGRAGTDNFLVFGRTDYRSSGNEECKNFKVRDSQEAENLFLSGSNGPCKFVEDSVRVEPRSFA